MNEVVHPMRERVERLEEVISQAPQVELDVKHHFAPGVYVREMTIPAGVVATGAVHKTEHLSILSAGRCVLTTDDGVSELYAPWIGKSRAGIKRAIATVTECVLMTIHPTDETDVEKLVELLTESTHAQLMGGAENKQKLANQAKELEGGP